ncbi:hypothetical protein BG20_I0870 [Candidatus Nitrosarchaeum limnium BG20]|uniref:Uncharacterized protein n=1 Tax=Candidatus Nitrosarchaeum limnium BG20 TaxID=859192 RepID=S2E680_9ARCH|nr:hypothetical protein BG20_I0870 [Candidatus Nitrosarchaeum limnium BG20]
MLYTKFRFINFMDLKKLIQDQSLTDFPVGFGGCRTTNSFF